MENTIYPANNDLPGDLHGYSWDVYTGELKDTTILNPTGEPLADILAQTIIKILFPKGTSW